ncbi:MAG: glycosyltransferase family 2 protein [Bacteroidales bacterium]|nr:glycosyltransferase family 2 protein [Bacteroidales bacterium]
MNKISAVIITFNEEKNIGRCIDSLLDVADDIVVVDSFSTDKTKEICAKKMVRFVEHSFEGHIEQKNFAITQALYPFVLSLDADEALSDDLKLSILEVKAQTNYDGYTMNRLTNYCGQWIKHCGWYPDRKLRLWNSCKGQWGGINPHDKFIMEKGSTISHLKGDLLHFSYYTVADHFKQIEKFSSIGAEALFKKGEKSNFFKCYAHAIIRFIKAYFFNFGFLDGRKGFIICKNSAYANFLKYKKLQKLNKQKEK